MVSVPYLPEAAFLLLRRAPPHALVQLLALPVEAVAANHRVDIGSVFLFEFVAKCAEVIVGFAHMQQFTRDEFDDDDVIEVTNNRNVVREDIFGVREIDEGCQQALAIGLGQLPFFVGQHAEQRFEFRNALADEVRQGLAAANFVEYRANGFDNFGIFRIFDGRPRLA